MVDIPKKNMLLYFAYGSNLDLKQMQERCPNSRLLGKGCLKGFRLSFTRYSPKWGGGVADVVPDQGSEVWGLIYELTTDDLHRLDKKEGYSKIYNRFQCNVETETSTISEVWVYSVVEKENFIPPANNYLEIIKNAAITFQFPEKYRLFLNTIKIK